VGQATAGSRASGFLSLLRASEWLGCLLTIINVTLYTITGSPFIIYKEFLDHMHFNLNKNEFIYI
jgi:hypothetical protein